MHIKSTTRLKREQWTDISRIGRAMDWRCVEPAVKEYAMVAPQSPHKKMRQKQSRSILKNADNQPKDDRSFSTHEKKNERNECTHQHIYDCADSFYYWITMQAFNPIYSLYMS